MQDEVFLPPKGVDNIRQRLRYLEDIESKKIASRLVAVADKESPAFVVLQEMKSDTDREMRQLKNVLANVVVVDKVRV